ncbi:MAG: hypothetical protein AAB838_00275 [Patescibacteria group bacterium]
MQIIDISSKVEKTLKKHNLVEKFNKAKEFFETDTNHPSLNVEVLQPKEARVYSFRIDRKYRAHFITIGGKAFIIKVTLHYQ